MGLIPRGDHPHDVILGGVSALPEVAGSPRGDDPRDVILGGVSDLPEVAGSPPREMTLGDVSDLPEVAGGPSAGDSLASGDIDLPEEVANDELDDLFVDVTTGSPKKEDGYFANKLRGKKKRARVFPGPTPADDQATAVNDRAPDVETYLGRSLGGALQDDVMEVFSPPRILEHTAALGLRGDLSVDLATGWDLSLEQHRANLLTEIVRRRPKIVFLEPLVPGYPGF